MSVKSLNVAKIGSIMIVDLMVCLVESLHPYGRAFGSLGVRRLQHLTRDRTPSLTHMFSIFPLPPTNILPVKSYFCRLRKSQVLERPSSESCYRGDVLIEPSNSTGRERNGRELERLPSMELLTRGLTFERIPLAGTVPNAISLKEDSRRRSTADRFCSKKERYRVPLQAVRAPPPRASLRAEVYIVKRPETSG